MTASEIIALAIKSAGITHMEAGKMVGLSPRQICEKLKRGTFSADMFLNLLNALNIEANYVNKDNGAPITDCIIGRGEHVRRMVKGVTYDTDMALPMANDFADGDDIFGDAELVKELYLTNKGQYFFAEYPKDKAAKAKIVLVDEPEATAFIGQYKK